MPSPPLLLIHRRVVWQPGPKRQPADKQVKIRLLRQAHGCKIKTGLLDVCCAPDHGDHAEQPVLTEYPTSQSYDSFNGVSFVQPTNISVYWFVRGCVKYPDN